MCGILGIVNRSNEEEFNATILNKMTKLLEHRGPDSQEIHINKHIAFGHRRLKIIDLSDNGNQPMWDKTNTILIIHNGEIYNYLELKKILEKKGHSFRTKTDTEVILKAYLEYGPDCLKFFNGMFAFAIFDSRTNSTFIARDRLGIKPLFFSNFDGRLIFASEVKSILAYPRFPKEANYKTISKYLSFRHPVGTETLFQNIQQLCPGHYMLVNKEGIKTKKYWSIPIIPNKEDLGEDYYIEKLQEQLSTAVNFRMISDVPIGAYLSGGLDSSIIVALMSKKAKVKSYTIGFEEEKFNEFKYSKEVSEYLNTSHKEIKMSSENYFKLLEKLIGFKDAPLGVPNEPALYLMSKTLKKDITVVLSGEGADELFGGYGRIFRSAYDFERIKSNEYSTNAILRKNLETKYRQINFSNIHEHFLHQYEYINQEEKQKFLSKDYLQSINNSEDITNYYENLFDEVKQLDITDQYLYAFEKSHLPGLLHRVDMTTMASSVEARVPFVDHNLVEFAFQIPNKYKLKWNSEKDQYIARHLNADQISEHHDTPKYILKKSYENTLPKNIVYRKKMGFPVPVHSWFNSDYHHYTKEILTNKKSQNRGIINTDYIHTLFKEPQFENNHQLGIKIWMLLNLELWFKKYIDNPS